MTTKQNVLVTGCCGYIGSVLCRELLRSGYAVLGIDNLMYGDASRHALLSLLGEQSFNFLEKDAVNLEGCLVWADAIIPLAAIVGEPACKRLPENARHINERAIVALSKRMSRQQRLIYPNTNSGYGSTSGDIELGEEAPLGPISVYGKTKVAAELAVLGHPMGVSLRLGTVFGVSPRMRFDLLVNDFTRKMAVLGYLELFEPHFVRSFVGIRDVVRAMIYMLENHGPVGPYNLASVNLTKRELGECIAETLGVPKERIKEGIGKDPDQRNYRVSSKNILNTGFVFKHDLVDGIDEVVGAVKHMSLGMIGAARNA